MSQQTRVAAITAERQAREQAEPMPVLAAALLTKLKEECEAQHARAEQAEQERDVKRGVVLQIAGLVNGYHNDGATASAAETLRAIADALGPALSPPDGQR